MCGGAAGLAAPRINQYTVCSMGNAAVLTSQLVSGVWPPTQYSGLVKAKAVPRKGHEGPEGE